MKKIIFLVFLCFALQASEMSIYDQSSSSSISSIKKNNSSTIVMFPIISALIEAEGKFMSWNVEWTGINAAQKIFLRNFFAKQNELGYFTREEIRSWASQDYEELNSIACNNGFNIQFKPFRPHEFGSLSILEVNINWLEKGIVTSLEYADEIYKAAKIKNNNFNVYELNENIYTYPIIEIKTQNTDTVYMTIADEPCSGFFLMKKINSLRDTISHRDNDQNHGICKLLDYDEVIFPFVNLNQEVDISWLKGMYANDGPIVSQALQQIKFKMNEFGAEVKSAVMVAMCKSIGPREIKRLNINKPFYLWIERENCTIPVFAGYIDPSDWIKVY